MENQIKETRETTKSNEIVKQPNKIKSWINTENQNVLSKVVCRLRKIK